MNRIKNCINKIINIIEKHDNIFMFFIILISTLSTLSFSKLSANDELWEFSNIYKLYNGFIIYKDLNVIQTPLYFYIGEIIFKIFGANYLVYRIYDRVIIKTVLFFSMYILFKKLKVSKKNSMIYILILMLTNIFVVSSTYNFLAIAIIIIGMICEKLSIKQYKKDILQGIIIFLVFLTKQNIGVYYMIGIFLYFILKEASVKEKIFTIFRTYLTSAMCLILFIIYLYFKGNLFNALDYTVYGLKEFGQKNILYNAISLIPIIACAIIEIVFLCLTFVKKFKKNCSDSINDIRLVTCIILLENLIILPIINLSHMFMVIFLFIFLFMYIMDLMMINEVLKGKKATKIKNIIILLISLILIIISVNNNIYEIKKINSSDYYLKKDSPYYGVFAEKNTLENINNICKYIQEQKNNGFDVKVISYYADLYENIYKTNSGNFDLPFYGNLGKRGEEGLIEDISNLNKTKILILKDGDNLYQEVDEAMEYIKKNFEYQGDIDIFSIYCKY